MNGYMESKGVQKTREYVGDIVDNIRGYASKLNTEAKLGLAALCIAAAGVGADYVLSREIPASAEASLMPVIEMPVVGEPVQKPLCSRPLGSNVIVGSPEHSNQRNGRYSVLDGNRNGKPDYVRTPKGRRIDNDFDGHFDVFRASKH